MLELTKIESAAANTVLDFFIRQNNCITHMKLQKILYFAAGYSLANSNVYIFEHNFQAWAYGPVLPSLYNELKKYRDTSIIELIKYENKPYVYTEGITFNDISNTINKLKRFTAWELSEKSHAIDGPWFKTVKEQGYKCEIKTESIKDYFKKYPI